MKSPSNAEQLRDRFPSAIRLVREFFDISADMQLETFWKELNHEQGPGSVLYVLGVPILVFDCIGFPKGHFHAHIGRSRVKKAHRQDRIHLPERTIEDQIGRCAFELRWNLRYYLNRHHNRQIQNFSFSDADADKASALLQQKLVSYLAEMPSQFSTHSVSKQMPESEAWNRRLSEEGI